MMRRRRGKPTEMRSDLPSHVTSVRATINATRAMVRRRGTALETYSLAAVALGPSGGPRNEERGSHWSPRPYDDRPVSRTPARRVVE